jgi:ribosome-binding protein aMBF1 (putative translation factor)
MFSPYSMEECFKCGISEDKAKLYDAISEKGLVKVCQRCSADGDLPIIKRKDSSLNRADKTAPVGGLIKEREKAFEQIKAGRKSIRGPEFSLRDLVEENYRKNIDSEKKSWPGVIRNFNWIILRARRNKGLGQKQLAEMIGEPEIAVRMVERGVLPKEYVPLIRKLEGLLEIDLMENNPFRLEEHQRMLNFKSNVPSKVNFVGIRNSKKREIEMIKSKELLQKEKMEKEAREQRLLEELEAEEEPIGKLDCGGFFKRFFSRKKQESSNQEEIESQEEIHASPIQSKEVQESSSRSYSQTRDENRSSSLSLNQTKETSKPVHSNSVLSKEPVKVGALPPGRTKPVAKYRWQK